MKTTRTGYRITKNGAVLHSIEKDAVAKEKFEGQSFKENGKN